MPNVMDIVEVAKALETKAVLVVDDRCTVVRNRHSTCTKCADACLADAVHAEKNKLFFDGEACIKCGACTTVCPCEALVPLAPLDEVIAEEAPLTMEAAGGAAVFACARIASKRCGDPTKYVEVPCLARMDEASIVEAAARGASEIVLVDGNCRTCKYRFTSSGTDVTAETAAQLIAAQGSPVQVRRASEFPECAVMQDYHSYLQESRRDFFAGTGVRAREAAVKSVETLVFKKNDNQVLAALRERMALTEDGTLPQFDPQRHMRILDAMDAIGPSTEPYVDTRVFGSVEIDTEKCKACKMCTVFCTTGALHKTDLAPEDGVGSFLEFSAAECVQCRLCEDSCINKCLHVNSRVSTDELFDFEPRLIHLPDPPRRPGMLGQAGRKKR